MSLWLIRKVSGHGGRLNRLAAILPRVRASAPKVASSIGATKKRLRQIASYRSMTNKTKPATSHSSPDRVRAFGKAFEAAAIKDPLEDEYFERGVNGQRTKAELRAQIQALLDRKGLRSPQYVARHLNISVELADQLMWDI